MTLLRRVTCGLLVLAASCVGACRNRPPDAPFGGKPLGVPESVVVVAELPALPPLQERVEDALHAIVGVVVGIRRIDDVCGSYLELRLFQQMRLGGREIHDPSDDEDLSDLRVLAFMKAGPTHCSEVLPKTEDLKRISVGDSLVVAVGSMPTYEPTTPTWKRQGRALAMVPIGGLPEMAAFMPGPHYDGDDFEQFLPTPRMPPVGTPASIAVIGAAPRFEVRGESIVDRAQGIAWQRAIASKPLSFAEAGFYCESLGIGGHRDWRLPTAVELHGLFAPGIPKPALVDRELFAAPPESLFWSRTDDDGPWVGSTDEGSLISTHYDDPSPHGSYQVRCVRSESSRATEMVDRFAKRDTVLEDALSGLSWTFPKSPSPVTSSVARRVCQEGTFGGYGDWEMPQADEAFSLMSACPEELQEWEPSSPEVWTAAMDDELKVGTTFRVCNLHRSVPLAAVFEEKGIDRKDPVASPICVRKSERQASSEPAPCLMGSTKRRVGNRLLCEENGVSHGPFRSFYPSGSVFEVGHYDRGVRSGMFVMYHESGGIHVRGDYVKGKLHGDMWAKGPTGQFLFKGAYAQGKPTGRWTFFDSHEREIEHVHMKEGIPADGRIVQYGDIGDKVLECATMRGWKHGIERNYEQGTGRVFAEFNYVGGWLDGPAHSADSNAARLDGQHRLGERDGIWIGKTKEGVVTFRQSYRAGKLDGWSETFDQTGKLESKRRFRDGVAIGSWEIRNVQGQIVQKGIMDDEGTGVKMWLRANGEVESEEHYVRGQLDGESIEYYAPNAIQKKKVYRGGKVVSMMAWHGNGKVAEQVTYASGKKNGLAERYTEDGRLLSRGQYVDDRRQGRWEFSLPTGRRFEVVFDKGRAVLLQGM